MNKADDIWDKQYNFCMQVQLQIIDQHGIWLEMMPQLGLTNRNSQSQICRNIAITMF